MKHVVLAVFFLLTQLLPAFAADIQVMSKEQLKAKLGSSDMLILDARSETQWESSQFKIPGAHWIPKDNTDQWVASLPKNKTLLVYCACTGNGLGASGRVAQELIDKGFTKVYALDGGWKAWQGSGYPVEARK